MERRDKNEGVIRLSILWRSTAALVLAFLASMALGEQAIAHSFSADFSVQAGHGYRISVSARKHTVRVLVTKGRVKIGKHVLESEYNGPASASPAGIEADLAPLGSISLRFHPSTDGRVVTSPDDCSPHKIYRRPGTFTGSFDFLGEGAYTSFEATELQGSIGMPDDLSCFTSLPPIEGRLPRTPYLAARTSNDYGTPGYLGFGVMTSARDPRHTYFTAASQETVAGLSVRRYVTEVAPIATFSVARDLHRAVVAPPAPFSGNAILERTEKGASPAWSGSLSVSFPGRPEVPLTGRASRSSNSVRPGFREESPLEVAPRMLAAAPKRPCTVGTGALGPFTPVRSR